MGFGASGGSSSQSSNEARDPDFPAIQKPFLQDLWGIAQGFQDEGPGSSLAALQAAEAAVPAGQRAANQMATLGTDMVQGTSAGQMALSSAAGQGLQFGNFGTTPQQQMLGLAGQGATDELVNQTGLDINRQLTRDILPALRGDEVSVGALGGSRGEISSGLAAQGAQQAFANVAANIRQADLTRRGNLLESLTSSGLQGLDLAGRQGAQYSQGQAVGAAMSSTAAQDLMNLGLAPMQAYWQPLQNYAALVNGSPQIGTVGVSSSRGSSYRFGFDIAAEN